MSHNAVIVNCEGSAVKNVEQICSEKSYEDVYYIKTAVPDNCKLNPCIFGIDEAGRGPVLGPMVYGIFYCPINEGGLLEEMKCADSKTLTEQKREDIFDNICSAVENIGWEVQIISPKEISNCMLRRQKHSLNEISHNAAINLLQRTLDAGAKITEVYVDTVGPAEKYQDKLQSLFPHLTITVSNKADSKYAVVGGASICAKVIRDICIRVWKYPELQMKDEENKEIICGSGYPGDPLTKKFLVEYMDKVFGFPSLVRFSWSTAEKILEENAVTVDWEDEEQDLPKGIRSVKNFFSNSVDLTKKEKHAYFKKRNLSSCTGF